jgi:hypothetical protein
VGSAAVDDYEAYAARSRLRFRAVMAGLLLCIQGALFGPWLLVGRHALSESSAELVSGVAVLLMVAVWMGLMTKLADPSDAPEPTPASRKAHLLGLLAIAGGILFLQATIAMFCMLLQVIEIGGFAAAVILCFVMIGLAGRALFLRAVRTAGIV